MKQYTVVVTREGDHWLSDVPEVPGAHTFARSLPSLLTATREAIIVMDDLDDNAEVLLRCRYDIDDETIKAAADLGERRRQLHQAEAALVADTAAMARQLVGHKLSVRDAAELLDVTPGRISQLAKA